MTRSFGVLMALGLSAAGLQGAVALAAQPAQPPTHIMVVLFENSSVGDVIKLPFFGTFAKKGAALMNFHAETHPSQPNYIGLISGDSHGCTNDDNITINASHIGDLLEAHGRTWKAYAEAWPGGCYLGARSGTYARKHEPFISFQNVQSNPQRCANIVNANQLDSDIADGKLPDFSLYIPDMNNDGHDTGPAYADKWFSGRFGPLLDDPRFMQGMLLVATFDEGDLTDPQNQIYTVLVGDSVNAGYQSQTRYNHYSLLRTFEKLFNLGSFGLQDNSAAAISDVWKQ